MKSMSNRTMAFLIKSRLDYSICDLCRYLDNEHKNIDCNDIKKNYVIVNPNGADIESILKDYIMLNINKCLDNDTEVPDDIDLEKLVSNNLDIFFEVSDDDESVFIECATI